VVHLAIPCVSVCIIASSAAESAAVVGALLDKVVYLFTNKDVRGEKKKVNGQEVGAES